MTTTLSTPETQPTNWPNYMPTYHSVDGWTAEKLQAEIKLREELNNEWTHRMFANFGTIESHNLLTAIDNNWRKIFVLNEELIALCRKAVFEG